MPTTIELGQKVKQKYPGVYDDMPDIDVGQKVKQKYPGAYDDFTDETPQFKYNLPTAIKTPEQRSVIKNNIAKENTVFQNQANKDGSTLGIIKNTIKGLPKAVFNTVASSEIGLGKTLAKLDNKPRQIYLDNLTKLQDEQTKLRRQISLKEKIGGDTSKLKQFYNENISQINNMQSRLDETNNIPTNNQAIGQIGGTALDLLTAGSYGTAKSSLPVTKKAVTAISPGLGKISEQTASGLFTKKGLGNIAKGAGIGYGYDVSQGLQGARGEDRTNEKAFIPGLVTALGTGIPTISEGAQSFKNFRDPEIRATKLISKRQEQLKKLNKYPGINKTILKGKDRGIDIEKTLSETDVLHRAVDKTGNIATKGDGGAVEQYTKQYIDGNEAIISDILKKEGRSISPATIKIKLNKAVMDAGIEGAALKQAQSKIDDEIEGYALRAGKNGVIPVSTLQDAKIDKYNNINFFTEGNTKKYDKTVAKALKELVQENTTSIDVQKVNEELSKHFAVIDYLNKLDGKKVDGGKLGKLFAQTTGAIVGSHYGPLGSIFGAEAGSRIKGNMMSKVFDGKTGKTLPISDIMNEATRVRDALPMQLPQSSSSNSLGNRNMSQSTTINPTKNPGILSTISQKLNKVKNVLKQEGGFATGIGYKNEGDLTTKILKDLEGKTTVSKQYILDATNRGELKQVERDITRQILDTMPDGQINVKEFADKVKSELLPLKVNEARGIYATAKNKVAGRYEHIALPDDIRGDVKNYKENIYESPIKTSAGQVHFGQPKDKYDNYFGHTRIEDMADNKTRRVIEVQSDLYQKGNLEKEVEKSWSSLDEAVKHYQYQGKSDSEAMRMAKLSFENQGGSISKLQQYNDPTAHFRMVREEIKKASQDGKTKLQFPTGETAMKIEGLGETNHWSDVAKGGELTKDNLQVGKEIHDLGVGHTPTGNYWIITDVLGDGKFKAVPKQKWDDMDAGVFLYSGEEKRLNELWGKNQSTLTQAEKAERDALFAKADQLKESFQFNREIPDTEQFDISGKVDTNNPIYKFYEKEVQKYLNKFGGTKVVDDKGVSWIEIPITKEQGKAPVDAFGKIQLGAVGGGALVGAGVVAGASVYEKLKAKRGVINK